MAQPLITCNVDGAGAPTISDKATYYAVSISLSVGLCWANSKITPSDNVTDIGYNSSKSMLSFRVGYENAGSYVVDGVTYNKPDAKEAPKIQLDIEHCTVEEYTVTTTGASKVNIKIVLKADEGYKFLNAKATAGGLISDGTFEISPDGATATFEMEEFNTYYALPVNITGDIMETASKDVTYIVNRTLVNCTGEIPETIKRGETLNVTLTATEGNKFLTTPTISYKDDTDETKSETFTVSGETKASISFDTGKVGEDETDITINATAEAEEITGKAYGSINVYATNDEELGLFAQKRFYMEAGSNPETGGPAYETIDLGGYVNRLFRLHVHMEATSEATIRCGDYDTKINTHIPDRNSITLDFGTVRLPAHNDNITDMKSTYRLMLPFNGFIDIPNEYAGREINLKYEINVITGGALAVISTDGIPFLFKETDVKTDIIYRTSEQYRADYIGADEWNETLFYGLDPFILVEWYESIDYGRNNDRKRVIIGGCEGFNAFDEIDPIKTETMTNTEQSKIYELLEAGVYIEQAEA